MKNYYEILGVLPNATQEEITGRYRFLVMAYHPDRYTSARTKKMAEEEIKAINEAYQVLSDKDKRKEYDEWLYAQYRLDEDKQDSSEQGKQYTKDNNQQETPSGTTPSKEPRTEKRSDSGVSQSVKPKKPFRRPVLAIFLISIISIGLYAGIVYLIQERATLSSIPSPCFLGIIWT